MLAKTGLRVMGEANLPAGSYKDTCYWISFNPTSGLLTASCKWGGKGAKDAKLTIPVGNTADIANCRGSLKLGGC
jgi:hypothetical protein